MNLESQMRQKLMISLQPTRLDVVNESHLHAGHRSSPGTGESHFRLLIVSEAFSGKSRVERHRRRAFRARDLPRARPGGAGSDARR